MDWNKVQTEEEYIITHKQEINGSLMLNVR